VAALAGPEQVQRSDFVTLTLSISGMSCQSCVAHTEEALARLVFVNDVRVDLGAAQATVSYDVKAGSVDELIAAVSSAGYTATLLAGDPFP
jgi:copper chaperone CopZ